MDTIRIIKSLFNISNAPKFRKPAFENSVNVRFGYAYAANGISLVRISFPFVMERGFTDWESIVYDEKTRKYGFEDANATYRLDEMIEYPSKPEYGFSAFNPVELARILRVFSACEVNSIITVMQDHYMLLEAYDSKKEVCITAKLMGMG